MVFRVDLDAYGTKMPEFMLSELASLHEIIQQNRFYRGF